MERDKRGLSLQEGLTAVIIVGLIGLFLGFFALFNDKFAETADLADGTVLNETTAFINSTGYTVSKATTPGFSNFAVTQARNGTSGATIASANYTYNSVTGTITNATAVVWSTVQLDYTYEYNGVVQNITIGMNTEYQNQTDILGLVLLAVFFGIAITALLASFLANYLGNRV